MVLAERAAMRVHLPLGERKQQSHPAASAVAPAGQRSGRVQPVQPGTGLSYRLPPPYPTPKHTHKHKCACSSPRPAPASSLATLPTARSPPALTGVEHSLRLLERLAPQHLITPHRRQLRLELRDRAVPVVEKGPALVVGLVDA